MNQIEKPSASKPSAPDKRSVPRVVVVQIGSRRNYAIPIALHQAGALERLYTDWYAPKDIFTRAMGALGRLLGWKSLARAASRQAVEIGLANVVHFPRFGLRYKWQKHWAAKRGELPRAYVWGGQAFCNAVLKSGLPPCDAVYCFSSVAKEILAHLEGCGISRLLDQEIPPLAYDDRLLREQEAAYAAWAKPRPAAAGVEDYAERQRQEWVLADVILCPSEFCRKALLEEGAPPHKIRMLPFGIHPKFFARTSDSGRNTRMRVLFAANTPIRKGLPDLVLALEKLGSEHIEAAFAGETTSLTPYALARAGRVGKVLGNVPRPQMIGLYRSADVFVLPTVSDTFGAVVLEAMAAGVPVIVTDHCGSADVVRDGVDGFIVSVRSPERLAEKLELLASNPTLRREMGRHAAERAKEYTIERYRDGLVAALQDAAQGFRGPSGQQLS